MKAEAMCLEPGAGSEAKASRSLPSRQLPTALSPDNYLIDLVLAKPIGKKDFLEGAKIMGFDRTAILHAGKQGTEPSFVGRLTRPIRPVDTALIRWSSISRTEIDVFRPLGPLDAMKTSPFVLEAGPSYDMRFVSRVKAHPRSEDVEAALRTMGWAPTGVVRVDDPSMLAKADPHSNTNLSVWFARAEWHGKLTVTTPEDPFYFEEIKKLA